MSFSITGFDEYCGSFSDDAEYQSWQKLPRADGSSHWTNRIVAEIPTTSSQLLRIQLRSMIVVLDNANWSTRQENLTALQLNIMSDALDLSSEQTGQGFLSLNGNHVVLTQQTKQSQFRLQS